MFLRLFYWFTLAWLGLAVGLFVSLLTFHAELWQIFVTGLWTVPVSFWSARKMHGLVRG